jgi:hypothetical protein
MRSAAAATKQAYTPFYITILASACVACCIGTLLFLPPPQLLLLLLLLRLVSPWFCNHRV